MKNVLLITGCICPNKDAIFLKISDANIRLQQYIDTVNWALNDTNFDTVIFCDNSNCTYDFNKLNNDNNKTFEYLTFKGDTIKCNKYGKGYGEGEIIKYSINNSKYLKNTRAFYKITGRLKISNINSIIKKSSKDNYFLRFLFSANAIDTRFYKINTKEYIKNFYNNYKKVRDKKGYTLERTFYDTLLDKKIKYNGFGEFPIVEGYSGSTGIKYETKGIKLLMYNSLCKLNLYNKKVVSKAVLFLLNRKRG